MAMTTLRTLALCTLAIGSPAIADPQADADYIVSQTVTREIFEGAFAALGPVITSAVQNDLRAQGISLPDPDRFMELFLSEFIDEFTEIMQAESAALYLDLFTEEELAGIAAFYATDAGQAFVAATPELMQQSAVLGESAGMRAGVSAGPRLADRIENEGLVVVDDPSLTQRILDALR